MVGGFAILDVLVRFKVVVVKIFSICESISVVINFIEYRIFLKYMKM